MFITAFYPYITEEVHGAQRGYEMCKGHTADTLIDVLTSSHCFRGVTQEVKREAREPEGPGLHPCSVMN